METRDIQDILPLVEGPSRYLGGEINAVRKNPADVRLHMALAFPDLYEIGTSHFGLQILYDIVNRRDDLLAERVFAPDPDMEARLRESGTPLATLESGTPLAKLDIIGVSLLYELCYTNILTILDVAGIPFRAVDRDEGHPLIIAGGPCTCNPEPVADFFDAMVVGDGEETILSMAEEWLAWRDAGEDRKALLRRWSQLRGVYIPSFYEAEYGADGLQRLRPTVPGVETVQRAAIPNLDDAAFPDAPVIPYGKPVHDRLRLEVARGCTRGCRFCQAGMIYRPVRERSPETLLAQAERALAATGYEDISLLSLSTGDYANIAWLMSELMGRCAADHVAVSLPSLRAGTLTPELMNLIKRVRKTGFTIAPEAGSQRLRDVINKNIAEDDIVATVTDAFAAGWQTIKLYFMVGLPTETQEDLDAIVALTDRLRDLRGPKGKRAKIHVSVGAFIPKPHTPFQWCPQLSLAESKARIEEMKARLSKPGVQFKWQSPKVSFLEGVFSRGDRRLAPLLATAWR
ncbi:MAG: TIGR03960 family B12-binding radical SAM protein, partial [Thermodesulfobacteriota bacterium]